MLDRIDREFSVISESPKLIFSMELKNMNQNFGGNNGFANNGFQTQQPVQQNNMQMNNGGFQQQQPMQQQPVNNGGFAPQNNGMQSPVNNGGGMFIDMNAKPMMGGGLPKTGKWYFRADFGDNAPELTMKEDGSQTLKIKWVGYGCAMEGHSFTQRLNLVNVQYPKNQQISQSQFATIRECNQNMPQHLIQVAHLPESWAHATMLFTVENVAQNEINPETGLPYREIKIKRSEMAHGFLQVDQNGNPVIPVTGREGEPVPEDAPAPQQQQRGGMMGGNTMQPQMQPQQQPQHQQTMMQQPVQQQAMNNGFNQGGFQQQGNFQQPQNNMQPQMQPQQEMQPAQQPAQQQNGFVNNTQQPNFQQGGAPFNMGGAGQ